MRSLVSFSLFICLVCASVPHNVWNSECDQKNLYEDLWEKNLDIAADILNSKFIKSLQSGSLPAHYYITFTLQDIYYLENVTEMLKILSTKVGKPLDLKTFFQQRYKSYSDYTSQVLHMCSLTERSMIQPHEAIKNYTTYYHKIMMTKEPIYFVIAMLPCSRLWTYLADKLQMNKSNAYYEFKVDNTGHPEKHYKPLLDRHLCEINAPLAHAIFRRQMKNEKAFFLSSLP